MQTISDTINGLHLGEATSFEGLTVFPLVGDHVQEKDYLTLDEALEQEQARVIEVSEAGDVPNLLFENLGDRKVLLVDGDELVGAKQNRIINLTILVFREMDKYLNAYVVTHTDGMVVTVGRCYRQTCRH
jgi:hypothetical protein